MKSLGRFCVITDTFVQNKYSHLDIAKMAIEGGANIIQFRDKGMNTRELIDTAIKLKKICDVTKTILIINDRVDVALIVNAHGVHLGNEDIPIKEARKLLGREKIIGGTAHSLREALLAQKEGANYLGFGHIFVTESKIKNTPPKGLKYLKKVVSKINIPIFAIGGINSLNLNDVMKTGVHGVAVISAVVKSDYPIAVVKKMNEIIYAEK